ncbi:hypothetical protein CCHR01_10512 [Colletotrichum chrysophilum]|uniref:Cytochrome P450 n=1 Tax=Colletotrichum chrysophilum TaxID=1836956 RepID=A0AAD9AH83_9PEZI|nr:hypothetical protein CCHR01_10512 [Colletotrichum chrysophilum]
MEALVNNRTSSFLVSPSIAEYFGPLKLTLLTSVILLLITTRLITGHTSHRTAIHRVESDGARHPEPVPYWIPYLGHIPNFILSGGKFLPSLRDKYPSGAVTIKILGTKHVFIFRHSLGTSLLSKPDSIAGGEWLRLRILSKAFEYPQAELPDYLEVASEWHDIFAKLVSGSGLDQLVSRTSKNLTANINRFVTFHADEVEQSPWEQTAKTRLLSSSHPPTVSTSLSDLVRLFVSHTANESLVGADFIENFPHFWDQLWEFNETWQLLVLGLPPWVGYKWPKLARAMRAQSEMLQSVREFHVALDDYFHGVDPGPRWTRLGGDENGKGGVSELIWARMPLYLKRGWSIDARASNELGLIWAMNINGNMLIFWMLYRIASDPSLQAKIRCEVAKFVDLPTETPDHGPTQSESTSINIEGLMSQCPLLKASYIESLRIDSSMWTFKKAKSSFIVTARESKGTVEERFRIPQGAYAYLAEELISMDPNLFPEPTRWRPQRHIVLDDRGNEGKVPVARLGNMRPYGGGPTICPGRNFAVREALAYVACIISVYDLLPDNNDTDWPNPKAMSSVGVKTVAEPYRVRIRRRE